MRMPAPTQDSEILTVELRSSAEGFVTKLTVLPPFFIFRFLFPSAKKQVICPSFSSELQYLPLSLVLESSLSLDYMYIQECILYLFRDEMENKDFLEFG